MKKSFSGFAAIFTFTFMCIGGCSKTTEIPDVSEYFSTDFDVKSFDAANLSVDTYEISEINGDELSELYPLACYNGKLYLTKGAVAESNFTEAETGRIIEYDLKTKTAKTIVECTLPSLQHSNEELENVSENDELIFVDYCDMGFYDNKLFFEKTSSYAYSGGFAEYYYYDTITGECELFFTPSSLFKCRQLVFLDDKVYFDDKYDFSAEGYSSNVYSYDLISKTVSLEKESAESPIAYGGEILYYCKDGFYTLDNEFVFSPNNSDFVDVSEVVGGSILSFCNSVYDESGERAIGSAVGYYTPETFERNHILTSISDVLYIDNLISAGNFIAWETSDPSPISFADVEHGDLIILSSDAAFSKSFVDDKRLNIISYDMNDKGFPTSFTVYSVEF